MAKAKRARPSRQPTARDVASRLRELDRNGASVPEVMRALREAGISDLEELVRRVIGKTTLEPEAIDLFAPVPEPEIPPERITHRPPKIPFTVGDVTYDPGDIKRFDGQTLYFVPRRLANGDHALLAFTGRDWLRSLTSYFQIQQHAGLISAASGASSGQVAPLTVVGGVGAGTGWYPGKPPEKGTPVVVYIHAPWRETGTLQAHFFEHMNFKGDMLVLAPNRVWADLTKRSRGFLGLGDWNDVISSVNENGATLLLFEHIQFGGDVLIIIPGTLANNLETFGWNDRVSSIKNFGQMY